jgi:hypothetical protein
MKHGNLISLADRETGAKSTWQPFLEYFWAYLRLGAGEQARGFILGSESLTAATSAEPWLAIGALILAASVARRSRPGDAAARMTALSILCYVGIGTAIYLLPRETWVHHWLLGTPFQYVAIALGLECCRSREDSIPTTMGTSGLLMRIVVCMLLTVRLAGLFSLESALFQGEASNQWHPNLTQIGKFAAARPRDTIFVAADWGVATQIYCISNGRQGLVHELFWNYGGPEKLRQLQKQSVATTVYTVSLNPLSNVRPENTQRIFLDLESSPHWHEVKVEPELAQLVAVTVRKFLYDPRPQ